MTWLRSLPSRWRLARAYRAQDWAAYRIELQAIGQREFTAAIRNPPRCYDRARKARHHGPEGG